MGNSVKLNINTVKVLATQMAIMPDAAVWAMVTDGEYGRTLAHDAAYYGYLPKGFSRWGLADRNGQTVAHVAICFGPMPKDFNRWGLMNNKGETVAEVALLHNRLPEDYHRWDLIDLPHLARRRRVLANSPAWAVVVDYETGGTLAHYAAETGLLPIGFDQWGLTDKDGYTVAEWAVRFVTLPNDFDRMDLINLRGLVHLGWINPDSRLWSEIVDPEDGETLAHWAARKDLLPKGFCKWGMTDKHGKTVADHASGYDTPMANAEAEAYRARVEALAEVGCKAEAKKEDE
jgi:hypothetical protein